MTQRCSSRVSRLAAGCLASLLSAATVAVAAGGSPASEAATRPALDTDAFRTRHALDPETGYRTSRYRAPVPDRVPGGTTLEAAAVAALRSRDGATLIDVYPPPGLGADPLDGHWIVSEPHQTIVGSIWLPEVGRGYLEPDHERYFRRNLERLRAARAGPLVFFCQSDCWQSWNAAKRAAAWGFAPVAWFPAGTDGWREHRGPLEWGRPLNFFDDRPQTLAVHEGR